MIDYNIFYKENFHLSSGFPINDKWDIFISAFNSNKRVIEVFNNIPARKKYWLVHHEYRYKEEEYPIIDDHCDLYLSPKTDEADFINIFFDNYKINIKNLKLCIDITGFLKPTLIYLLLYLKNLGITKFDSIYSEPIQYIKKEGTPFSDENVHTVRQVAGFEGNHVFDTDRDILIIGTGYEHTLIAQVAETKNHAHKIKVFGLPSLMADMYHENILRVQKVAEMVGSEITEPDGYFAPANDPFITANVLQKIINDIDQKGGYTNIYLCPLGTKAQALGFALYYLIECKDKPISIIYPFCSGYTQETSVGLSRIWKYTIEYI